MEQIPSRGVGCLPNKYLGSVQQCGCSIALIALSLSSMQNDTLDNEEVSEQVCPPQIIPMLASDETLFLGDVYEVAFRWQMIVSTVLHLRYTSTEYIQMMTQPAARSCTVCGALED